MCSFAKREPPELREVGPQDGGGPGRCLVEAFGGGVARRRPAAAEAECRRRERLGRAGGPGARTSGAAAGFEVNNASRKAQVRRQRGPQSADAPQAHPERPLAVPPPYCSPGPRPPPTSVETWACAGKPPGLRVRVLAFTSLFGCSGFGLNLKGKGKKGQFTIL